MTTLYYNKRQLQAVLIAWESKVIGPDKPRIPLLNEIVTFRLNCNTLNSIEIQKETEKGFGVAGMFRVTMTTV